MTRDADPLHRSFRPRAARLVCLPLAAVSLALMVGLAVGLPAVTGVRLGWGDRVGFVALGALIAWFLLREAGVRADPDGETLVVRNLLRTRRLAWAEIVSVRFGPDRPWVSLDLAGGDTLAVMAVQHADGDRARGEARRLATLVARHSGTARDD
ncbi:PH domain-containing protein [Actinotalea fermentans]|uniref:Low molecular weight protein antigen 6 PH domain-containing protein n=1 Tax=Actinotalea fermentans TaxID=43671 RepID=A0A511YUL6_9CELL|nr:PH domain-containing protein [Actinotalea fermentans]KGM15813.1 hypothetical protein N867_05330 [Actinotalea fermentans ATCC 43279 = JCM 9966 = DSM 3133]GEN78890.1 hypothetical protein AFE02nite_06240 [Actinotalea fermentans]